MRHEHGLEEFPWLRISRPRRLTIGDLMVGVALAALGACGLSMTLRSQWSGGEQSAFGILVLIVLGLQVVQWGLASIPIRRVRAGMNTFLGIVSYFVAMVTYVCLFILAAAFPEGAVLVVVTMLVLVIYRTTWD
jgi:hypothetical protein